MKLYAPDWELSFNVRIATQTILSEVVKVVQVNNATDVRIAGSVLLPTTHTKPIFLTLITDQRWIGQSQHDTNVGHYDLSAFILIYYQGILPVSLYDCRVRLLMPSLRHTASLTAHHCVSAKTKEYIFIRFSKA